MANAKMSSNNRDYGSESAEKWRPPEEYRIVSLKTIAELLDTSRSSARRWLTEAGIRPLSVGRGKNGAIRFRWAEVKVWLESREQVD